MPDIRDTVPAVVPQHPVPATAIAWYERLRALAEADWLAVQPHRVRHSPTLDAAADDLPDIAVVPGDSDETFNPAGGIEADQARGTVLVGIAVKGGATDPWSDAVWPLASQVLTGILSGVRAGDCARPVGVRVRPVLGDPGKVVVTRAIVEFQIAFATAYPPVSPATLDRVDIVTPAPGGQAQITPPAC